MRSAALVLAGALLAGACTALRQAPPEPWVRDAALPPATENERLLAYFEWLQRLPAADLARERERTRRALAGEASDPNRLRHALALTVPGDGVDDAARALEVLEPVARNRASPQQPLAILLRTLLADQRRAALEHAELRRKLDALKALEKSMSGREAGEK